MLVGAGMDLSVINPSDPSARSALVVAGFLFLVAIVGKVAAGWAVFGPQEKRTNWWLAWACCLVVKWD